jgi:hypothetical protein
MMALVPCVHCVTEHYSAAKPILINLMRPSAHLVMVNTQ